jgi:hypothetical protein
MKMKQVLVGFILFSAIVFSAGCSDKYDSQGQTQKYEARATEDNQARLIKSCPPPNMSQSLERENLKRRLELLNKNDGMLYVALLSYDGKVLATYVTHKVSSVNSLMTTPEQIVHDPYAYQSGGQVVSSPDLDGSYGTNGDGIFFFTTDGAYIEWNGLYIEQSQPFTLSTPPVLTKSA